MFYLTYHSAYGPMNKDGTISDLKNIGVIIFFVNVLSHHLIVVMETRNHTYMTCIFYGVSLGFLVITIWFDDIFKPSVYFGLQFSYVLSSPKTYLLVIIQCFVIYLPRLVIRNLNDVVFYPQFSKIKGA